MMKNLFIITLAIVLAVSFSSVAFAQDATKKEMKKEEKHVYKSVSCNPQCGFIVRSHDDNELNEIVKTHAKKQHNMDMTDKDVQGMAKTEGAPEMKKEMMKEEKKETK